MTKQEQLEIDLHILQDSKVSQEIKVNILLEMLYLEEISLAKARELCTECGIFTKHWMTIEEETVRTYNEHYHKSQKR